MLFLLFDDADILTELHQLFVVLALSTSFLLLVKKKVDLVLDAHALVLFVVVFEVSHWILRLSRDQPLHLILLLIDSFLLGQEFLELVDKVKLVSFAFLGGAIKLTLLASLALDMHRDFLLVAFFLELVSFLLGLEALVEDAFQLRVDLELFKDGLSRLSSLLVVSIREHFYQKLSVHLEHLALNVHVVVQIVVSLRAKLDLLEVDFDADLADVYVLKREIFLKAVSALVCDIAERIQQLLCPALIQWNVGLQRLVQIGQQLLQRFALLDLKEVLIVVWVAHVVETQIAGAVLGEEKLFRGANLVEELGEELVVLEALRDQVAFDRQAFVTIVS